MLVATVAQAEHNSKRQALTQYAYTPISRVAILVPFAFTPPTRNQSYGSRPSISNRSSLFALSVQSSVSVGDKPYFAITGDHGLAVTRRLLGAAGICRGTVI